MSKHINNTNVVSVSSDDRAALSGLIAALASGDMKGALRALYAQTRDTLSADLAGVVDGLIAGEVA